MFSIENAKNENGKIETLRITDSVYENYKYSVMGNLKKSKNKVAKKLTRNVLLGIAKPVPETKFVWYAYGALRIRVFDGYLIDCILNHQPIISGWEVDVVLKGKLNKSLGIV